MRPKASLISLCPRMFGVTLLSLAACASVGTSDQKQSIARDDAQRCVASSLDRNKCAKYANQRCASGFDVFEMEAPDEDGVVRRGFYFQCLP